MCPLMVKYDKRRKNTMSHDLRCPMLVKSDDLTSASACVSPFQMLVHNNLFLLMLQEIRYHSCRYVLLVMHE